MDFYVEPSGTLNGKLSVPGDKSISHRAIIFAAIADGVSEFSNFLDSKDCLATLHAFQVMGVETKLNKNNLFIHGVGLKGLQAPKQSIDVGNSGTSARLLAGLLGGQNFNTMITGDDSLSRRPMRRIIEPLSIMGVRVDSNFGCLPLKIKGSTNIKNIEYKIPVASAQVKSCILLASLYSYGRSNLYELNITRDHSERMLQAMQCPISVKKNCISIEPPEFLKPLKMNIPGDFSSAVFLIVAALISDKSSVLIKDVGINPTRIGFLKIAKKMGANIYLSNHRKFGAEPVADILIRSSSLRGITLDDPELISLSIDEFPAIFILAAYAKGKSKFSNLAELRLKESDRITSMVEGMTQIGLDVKEDNEGVVITGGRPKGGTVSCFSDHRVAMSFAIAAIGAKNKIIVKDVESVDTSFPKFLNTMQEINVKIKEI
ncbi:MAG: 3-phosphoshikimate 1-carboxyvinyltransferase [Pseudomonadota bacterium]|nr:3-phosphoshikimate 1-carboxyvinyltransferase [Pseudomonadota bacterium]